MTVGSNLTELQNSEFDGGADTPSAGVDAPPESVTKARLAEIFRRMPDLMTTRTLEEILACAAETLTGAELFRGCELFLEDVEQGILYAAAGAVPDARADITALYETLSGSFDRDAPGFARFTGADTAYSLASWLDQTGHRIGLVRLSTEDSSLLTEEMQAFIRIFLLEASQAVEQLRLKRELEVKEATYRSLVDNVSDVIFRVDREGRFTFISRQVEEMLGLEWRQVRGARVLDIVSPRDEQRALNAYQDLISGRTVNIDLTLLRPDGQEVIAFIAARPQLENGIVTGALGIARDVTEKRRLEIQIADSERRYRALTENAYDAIILVDPDNYAIVDTNPQMERLTGYSRAELLNMTVLDLRRPEQSADVRRLIDSVMSTAGRRFEDISLIAHNGKELSVETAASVYEIEGKRYYQAIIRDITVQKRMNEALEQQIKEMQVLATVSDALQSAVDLQSVLGIVLTGVTAGSGLGFNRAFILSYDKVNCALHGEAGLGPRTAEEAGKIWAELESRGLSLAEILDEMIRSFPEDADQSFAFARHFYIVLDDDENIFWQALLRREAIRVNRSEMDPHLPAEFLRLYMPWEFAIVPLVTRDEVMGVMLADNLFTQRPILEADLNRLKVFANSAASAVERSRLLINLERKINELTLANQDLKISRDRLLRTERLSAIGEVAASVAHEIRNPLTAIGGFARSVYSSLGEEDKNRRKIEVILEETDRLEHMLASLLEFTRPAVPRFTEMDMNALILQTVHFMGTEIDQSLHEVVYELNPGIPRVWADGQQIRQVLLNIMRNALQEMPKGGRLTLTTSSANNEVYISVRDTGAGIEQGNKDKIFEAFYTTKPAGSGLGLAICAQIVRNHNGRIEVDSQPGQGATFTVTLPAAKKALDS